MSQYIIHSWPGNPRGNACWVTAELAEVNYVMQETTFQDAQKPEYLAKHSLGKSPLLEAPEGVISQCNTIMRFLARKAPSHKRLLGKNAFEEGLVNQWLDFCSCELVANGIWFNLAMQVYGRRDFNAETFRQSQSDLNGKLRVVENYLKLNTYLAGHQLTIADICLYSWLSVLMAFVLDENWRKANSNIVRWFIHIGNNDAVRKYFGKVQLCQTVDPYGINKKKDEKKEKKPAQQPAQKKEQPKKKEEKKEEAPVAVEVKAKNPLDELPPTKFNFFDFKTLFVNAPDKNDALKFFWENLDTEGFSIWYIKYIKYEGEGQKLYLTSNLKDSFMQRLDHFRKYGFGVHGVYGDEPNLEIRGVWVWRGKGHPQEIKDLPNYEYHTYEELDPKNEAHRQIVKEYWTGLQNGVSVADGLKAQDVGYFK